MNSGHLNALFWSQWVANDVPWPRRMLGAWHLRRCAHCRAAAQSVQREQAAYAQSVEFLSGLADLQRRQPTAPQRRVWPAMALVGSMATMLLGLWHVQDSTPLRAKGSATQFNLYVQRGHTVEPLGAECQEGDAVRAKYQSTLPYLLVVEIDGRGNTQVVFPAGGQASLSIASGRHLTPGSWVLDGSPRQERFVAMFSQNPLTLSDARACIDAASACDGAVIRREVACSKGVHTP